MAKQYENEILNDPYDPPASHYRLDFDAQVATSEVLPGRRPSGNYLSVPNPRGAKGRAPELPLNDTQELEEPYTSINQIRRMVSEWRTRGYPGVSENTKRLLNHWRHPGERERRPYFAQIDAIETLIWLIEAGQLLDHSDWKNVIEKLEKANRKWNHGIHRVATKMATGTGKTQVMQMLIAYLAVLTKGKVEFIAITPGLTIKDRLQELKPYKNSPYDELVPRELRRLVLPVRVHVINYQAISQERDNLTERQRQVFRLERVGPQRIYDPLSKLVGDQGDRTLVILNDEAHHCYDPPSERIRLKDGEREAKEYEKESRTWFEGIRFLHKRERKSGRTLRVFDFSATPMFLVKPKALHQESELFPWTVSDYPLIEAMEAGLTKQPRVPVSDTTVSAMPRFRNIYESVQNRQLNHARLPKDLREAIQHLHNQYKSEYTARRGALGEHAVPPCMIVVANSIQNATAIYRYIAGYRNSRGAWIPGKMSEWANINADGAPPISPSDCRTLLLHSGGSNIGGDAAHDKLAEGWELHMPKRLKPDAEDGGGGGGVHKGKRKRKKKRNPHAKEQVARIRDIFNSVGKLGELGEGIRCVVSVGMLTEGWDARNVTHILGFRAFRTQLLCEQVVGRGLRRSGLGIDSKTQRFIPETVDVLGVPFNFIHTSISAGNGSFTEAYRVRAEPERAHFEIRIPNIVDFVIPTGGTKWQVDPDKVSPYEIPDTGSVAFTEATTTLNRALYMRSSDLPSGDVKLQLAQILVGLRPDVDELDGSSRSQQTLRALKAIDAWLQHSSITWAKGAPITALLDDEHVARQILQACEDEDIDTTPQARFGPWGDSTQPDWISSARVNYTSHAPRRHKTVKSHIPIAPCDSNPELTVCCALDDHPEVGRWVRNAGLGFEIPYTSAENGSRRHYRPDFVAMLTPTDTGGRPIGLIIEFKGQDSPEEQAKMRATEQLWIPAANGLPTNEGDVSRYPIWHLIWITDPKTIFETLDTAIAEIRREPAGSQSDN